jgi:dihydrofolate synthase/folylpolyglutamate synthase
MNREAEAVHRRILDELASRRPDADAVPSLDREAMLVDLLGTPQAAFPVIHITGTNGKSSTARMVDALLRQFGLRVGRFTSPVFEDLNERISIDGQAITPERFDELYAELVPFIELVDAKFGDRLTIFEILTAMAYVGFADAPVDIAVVEVGMGGSWDSTNVADGRVAVLTPIGLDHQNYLGDTVRDIALEKSGIIKPGAYVICAAQPEEAAEPILERCAEVGATIAREGAEFGVRERGLAIGGQVLTIQGLGGGYDEVYLPLHGAHQAQNAAVALAAVEAFLGAGPGSPLDVETVRAGFVDATSPGRLERVRSSPTILLDAAHNPHGMAATVAALEEEFDFRRLVAVLAVFADKDALGMLELLEPAVDKIVITRNSSERSMSVTKLAGLAIDVFGEDRIEVAPDLPDAIAAAVYLAEADLHTGLSGVGVIITGSVQTVADARKLLQK